MRKFLAKHFLKRREEFVEQKGAGPDFMKKGKAVEVKGSKFDQKKALKQLTNYIYKHAGIEFALPIDALTPDLIYGLRAIEWAASTHELIEKRHIRIHLVSYIDRSTSAVETFDSAEELLKKLNRTLEDKCRIPSQMTPNQAINMTSEFAIDIWKKLIIGFEDEIQREHNRVSLD